MTTMAGYIPSFPTLMQVVSVVGSWILLYKLYRPLLAGGKQ